MSDHLTGLEELTKRQLEEARMAKATLSKVVAALSGETNGAHRRLSEAVLTPEAAEAARRQVASLICEARAAGLDRVDIPFALWKDIGLATAAIMLNMSRSDVFSVRVAV